MSPQVKVLITGLVGAIIPVMTLAVSTLGIKYGVQSWPTVIAGAMLSAAFAIYKYLSMNPYKKEELKNLSGE